eukprot:349737-Pyramimonas_sp.AAC.1
MLRWSVLAGSRRASALGPTEGAVRAWGLSSQRWWALGGGACSVSLIRRSTRCCLTCRFWTSARCPGLWIPPRRFDCPPGC